METTIAMFMITQILYKIVGLQATLALALARKDIPTLAQEEAVELIL
jgi:uncharacterized membrane protein YuzA (DUF378 family)